MVDLIILYHWFVSRVMGGDPDTQSITRYIKAFLTKVQASENCLSAINKEESDEREKKEKEKGERERNIQRERIDDTTMPGEREQENKKKKKRERERQRDKFYVGS